MLREHRNLTLPPSRDNRIENLLTLGGGWIELVIVISKRGLLERAAKFADAKSALQVWFDTAVEAEWRNLEDVRKSFPATDMVGDLAVFNIRAWKKWSSF